MPANIAQLEQISQEVSGCTKCPLAKTRCKAVPGEGNPNALVMFIGEAPGKNEDLQGRPFVGDAGKLLDALLKAIDLQREDVFIANSIKCRPPGNRDPLPSEIETCKNYLDRQIATINPRLIVTLGRISMARYFPGKLISQIHGQSKVEGGRIILPMYHPAAALRDQNGRGPTMAKFKEDGLTIPDLLEKSKEIARTEIWGVSYAEPSESAPLKVAEETAPPLKVTPSAHLQPTLQPAVETRPGEVTPMERIILPELPTRKVKANGVGHLGAGNGTQVSDISQTDIITSNDLADSVVTINQIGNETNLAEGLTSKLEPEPQTVKKNGVARRKKKDSQAMAEQLTLF